MDQELKDGLMKSMSEPAKKREEELAFYLEDLIEQIEQFPQFSKGINMTYAKRALARAGGK